MYRVRVGSFETSLCVFKFAVGEKNYVPVAIARGQFGKVSYMKYRDEEFAFKNIRLRENSAESLELALCEVFMMKLASCLEVGPHFRSIMGYDAIIFEDCLQVGMEFCKTDYGEEQVEQYRNSRNLFQCLKTMHTLGFYHGDIKYDNIGWSPRFKKFIFLDFGFSKFLSEPVGHKTVSRFQGTYNYCSEEMKKLFLLKQSAPVDLYYNDLHCLQKTSVMVEAIRFDGYDVFNDFRPMAEDKSKPSLSQAQLDLSCSPQNFIIEKELGERFEVEDDYSDYTDMMPFFALKYLLFRKEFGGIGELVARERKLIYTFRKVLYDEVKENQDYKFYQEVNEVYRKHAQLCEEHARRSNKIRKDKESALYFYSV